MDPCAVSHKLLVLPTLIPKRATLVCPQVVGGTVSHNLRVPPPQSLQSNLGVSLTIGVPFSQVKTSCPDRSLCR